MRTRKWTSGVDLHPVPGWEFRKPAGNKDSRFLPRRQCNWVEEKLRDFRQIPATQTPYRIKDQRFCKLYEDLRGFAYVLE